MFIVLLRFSDQRERASEFMSEHNDWIRTGFEEGVFLLAGRLQPDLGGAIVARRETLSDLKRRVDRDPFVAQGVVSVEILEVTPGRVDERLESLLR